MAQPAGDSGLDVTVRREAAGDAAAVRAIHVAAFRGHPFSQQTEHLIVDALRDAGALDVSLVAVAEGRVVGHVAFSAVTIGGRGGWSGLGPLGVLPSYQGLGIGSRLVEEGLSVLRESGVEGCVLVGEPSFYGRLGFRNDPRVAFEGVPDHYVLCLPLAGEVPHGVVIHHAAFHVTAGEDEDGTEVS